MHLKRFFKVVCSIIFLQIDIDFRASGFIWSVIQGRKFLLALKHKSSAESFETAAQFFDDLSWVWVSGCEII